MHYFAEDLGTIHGTPLVPIELDISPSMDARNLKLIVCYATGLIHDMMALVTQRVATQENRDGPWNDPVVMLGSYRTCDNQTIGELDTDQLALSIDIEWLKRCPVCGKENALEKAERVHGFDNIPDYDFHYHCSNPECSEQKAHKRGKIRIAQWKTENGTIHTIPLVSAICNITTGAVIRGSKDEKPGPCFGPETIHDDSIYCHCGARSPAGVSYCWNCGKKNKNVQHVSPPPLPYDLENLRAHVKQVGQKARTETIGSDRAFVDDLIKRREIVKIKFCDHCGAKNEATVVTCQKCGKKMSPSFLEKKKKPKWKFW